VLLAASPGLADSDRLSRLEAQMRTMKAEIETLRAEQEQSRKQAPASNDFIRAGTKPGSFIFPGTETEVQIGGYIKGDLIYDVDEALGDVFVPEAISVTGPDEARFRAHARQSRLYVKTSTPTESGPLKSHFEADFFGGGGNEVFSNSYSFRLRHAYASWNGFIVGQTWSNFMPIESYPTTVDFNGPAGIPFVRQAQIRYTTALTSDVTVAVALENSEFSGRNATGPIAESTNLGIRAGVDQAPDVTLSGTWKQGWGMLKLAGVGRYLGSPVPGGNEEFGWGLNVSGNAELWKGGTVMASFTYGDGIGRYLINGFGQDAFVRANGSLDTIEAYGVTVALRQQLTPKWAAGLAYGRYEAMDTFAATDLRAVNTVHASLFYTPIPRITAGAEVIWGNRENANGASDDALRLQGSLQLNF